MSTDSDIAVCSPREVKTLLATAAAAGVSAFVWGPPGVGKSDIVQQIANEGSPRDAKGNIIEATHVPVYDVRLLLLDPTDLKGMPYRSEITDTVEWSEPSILPLSKNKLGRAISNDLTDAELQAMAPKAGELNISNVERLINTKGDCILFLDELTAAPPSVQAAAYQLVLDRKIGDYELPEGCKIIAAGNRKSDKGVVYPMPTPLSNRFLHMEIKPVTDDWLEWAVEHRQHPAVIGYISEFGQKLFDDKFSGGARAFCTPRSWSFVSKIIYQLEKMNIRLSNENAQVQSLIAGCIGQGDASDFMSWAEHSKDLPKVQDILSGKVAKVDTKIMKNVSAQYFLSTGLCFALQDAFKLAEEKDELDKFYNGPANHLFNFLNNGNFRKEILVMTIRQVLQTYQVNLKTKLIPSWKKFYEDNNTVIQAALRIK